MLQMAEGGTIEKFPDSWDPQYLGTVVVEYLLDSYPVDILIKRLVCIFFFFFFLFFFICYLLSYLIQDESPHSLTILIQGTGSFLHHSYGGMYADSKWINIQLNTPFSTCLFW